MFHRIGQFVVKRAWWVIVAWLIAAVAISVTAPKLASSDDESDFLPRHYESIVASDLQQQAFPEAFTPSAMLLFQRTDGGQLTADDKAAMTKVTDGLTAEHIQYVQTIVPVNDKSISKDGKYALSLIGYDKNAPQSNTDTTKKLRDDAKTLAGGTDLKVQLGGQAATNLDQQDSSSTADALIFLGSFVLIVVILAFIFRSAIISILPLLLIMAVIMPTSNALIADATKLFGLKANSTMSAILIVVLLGVGTDYFLFLMFRYRERLRAGEPRKQAMVSAIGRVGEAIASAAGAVTVAFAVLILSSLGLFKAIGPALAIAVVTTAIASITLVPAVLSVIPEKALFWPGKKWRVEKPGARFAALGRMTQRRPGLVAAVSGGFLILLTLCSLGYKGTFDLASGSMPKTKESMVVQNTVMSAFSAGASDPSQVYVTSTNGSPLDKSTFPAYTAALGGVKGVSEVAPQPLLSKDGMTADFSVTLKDDPASNAAIATMDGLRSTAHSAAPAGTKALVGGQTAVEADINAAMDHDYKTVFPIAAVLIMVILGLLLRSVVAPWYLMASVGLGFGATLGATSVVFQKFDHQSGLMFMLPIFIYLFVVAIGTDYNILMIARLREEAREGRSPREAAYEAIKHGGPTVASAGSILAASFATFMLAGNVLFSEIGFSIAFGIALSAFVMAMFFTPALTALLGRMAWWPGHQEPEPVAPGQWTERDELVAARYRK
ncbi:MMPL family transporter [Kitasatospora kifunensis]|uniref:RND superfamily putative drug exporter n=1 Tax=Kitasatospora kifunensis TaxID=58351 RepID=A0A7W7QZL9_KITKI|nr:MMPL family transporter [Kitasatospora kifunensis]MBB4922735.1 RND superfamily putative drug exporter [Kitasatospora kifunensis]